ncbi:MAG: nitroreductase family protein [Actinomycetota bacterium]|nr:nitroreductase family protein [Actinomycetota bacterium]
MCSRRVAANCARSPRRSTVPSDRPGERSSRRLRELRCDRAWVLPPAPPIRAGTARGAAAPQSRFSRADAAARSVRHFSSEPVAPELIENALRRAASSPSGANQQPWKFVVVSDPAVKAAIARPPSARSSCSTASGPVRSTWRPSSRSGQTRSSRTWEALVPTLKKKRLAEIVEFV